MIVDLNQYGRAEVTVPWDYPPQANDTLAAPAVFGAMPARQIPCTSCGPRPALAVLRGFRGYRPMFGDATDTWSSIVQVALAATDPSGLLAAYLSNYIGAAAASGQAPAPNDFVQQVVNDSSLSPEQKTAMLQGMANAAATSPNANVGSQISNALQGAGAGVLSAGQGILAGAEGVGILFGVGVLALIIWKLS